MLIVGTTTHLEDLDRSYTFALDVSVTALTANPSAQGLIGSAPGVCVLLDGERIDKVEDVDLAPLVPLSTTGAQSMAATATGDLLVGLVGAHLMTVSLAGAINPVTSFDSVPGRDTWRNPAGSELELRSIAVTSDDRWFANVHVGGVWRSDDQGSSWRSVLAPETDVHEIVAGPNGRVAVAAQGGLGWSDDNGDSWQWTAEGLHAPYARAVALDGDTAYVTASTGPQTSDGRLYRCTLGSALEPCGAGGGLPGSFPFNLDSGSVTAISGQVALGTHDGQVFHSRDGGSTFERIAQGMRPVRILRYV
ncbi:MAG: WD40/YVTN/BNR-like repeat-containing protein [Acidimicrobiales bacterium]